LLFHTERKPMVGWCVLGERLIRVLRAEKGWGCYRGVGSALLLGALLTGCTIDPPNYAVPTDPGDTPVDQNVDPNQPSHPTGSKPDAGSSVVVDAGQSSIPMEPVGGCTEGATRPCGPQTIVGTCRLGTRVCHEGAWSECDGAIMPAARDCSSPLDNDCDGLPDNTIDEYCRCAPATTEACDPHPGFDNHGPCVAGERTCLISSDKQSSDWSECVGAVGPVPQDSCSVPADDSDCDGIANGGCACIEGTVAACGPPVALGICKKGTSTCVNAKPGDCIGATYAKALDCTSTLDNNCDGSPDKTGGGACSCVVGTTQPCGAHAGFDGIGSCKAGTQTCEASLDKKSSAFGACIGSVGPAPRNCTLATDNDCNGLPDNTLDLVCACTIGVVSACQTHVQDGFGICHAGQALCIAGANNSSSALGACSGSVGPLVADSCTVAGDDSNCNGIANDSCECVVSSSCSSASAARCSAGKCVACTSNTDCAHFAGLGVCSAGSCVQCTAASAAACSVAQVCDAATSSCVAAPPPPPPPPPTP
jgi:hypothetical protein